MNNIRSYCMCEPISEKEVKQIQFLHLHFIAYRLTLLDIPLDNLDPDVLLPMLINTTFLKKLDLGLMFMHSRTKIKQYGAVHTYTVSLARLL